MPTGTADDVQRRYPAPKHHPVLVTEVTRMTRGYYCVAGWDVLNSRMVRPLQSSGYNWRLDADRSVFRVGALLDCSPSGQRRAAAYPHATEDLLLARTPSPLEHWDERTTYAFLLPTTVRSIRELFGRPLTDDKFLADGTVCASLGGVRIRRDRTAFERNASGKLRFRLHDSDGVHYGLPVTCDWPRHLFSPGDGDSEPFFGVPEANEWLGLTDPATEIVLRIGLARGWGGSPDGTWSPRRCYVQLNGVVCPEDNYHIFAGSAVGSAVIGPRERMNVLFTIGHSTHSVEKVVSLLRQHGVTAVADVRSRPYSRINPQFNREAFTVLLKAAGIAYVFLGRELGARSEDRNCYVEGKVQYDLLAQTELFGVGLHRVIQGMSRHRVALMCAEKDPLTCHRTILVCRHLAARGVAVEHILEDGRLETHDAALSRLLNELGLPEHDLFRGRDEIVEEAYAKRGERIAYSENEALNNQEARGVGH